VELTQVAGDLDLAESLVRGWVRQAEADDGRGPTGALTTAEKEELSKLRREVTFISQEKVAFPVAVLCRVLAVSPSGYYASCGRLWSTRVRRDQELSERVAAAHLAKQAEVGNPARARRP
jgi:transposase-like protein